MPLAAIVRFASSIPEGGIRGAVLVPVAEGLAGLPAPYDALLARAAPAGRFKGKPRAVLDVLAPEGLGAERVLFLGLGALGEAGFDWTRLGGVAMGRLGAGREAAALMGGVAASHAADFGLGLLLRSYAFDLYKTKGAKRPDDEDDPEDAARITLHCDEPAEAERLFAARLALAEGVGLARDLVNEPPNVLFPEAFAQRLEALRDLGVGVEVMDGEALEARGMRALTAVARGSVRDARVVIMRWEGGAPGAAPFAVVGKGVTFDSGGISIKPAAGMEDMKGDMAGAACVAGLMHALAKRGAKANVVGVVGLVENMPDGAAYRPGDVLTSLSGRTIEVINTDAEGRLVLADLLWHVKEEVKPSACVNLATLTGAILVALGQENAGLFSNDDALSERLAAAGKATGETVWRLPLSDGYDKLIDSKVADMKNTGGRYAGSISAAQFLKRFVGDMPWAHLDIAGVGFAPAANDLSQGFASGWGVRLLDRLVADHYEVS